MLSITEKDCQLDPKRKKRAGLETTQEGPAIIGDEPEARWVAEQLEKNSEELATITHTSDESIVAYFFEPTRI